jgi:phosphate-selective porin OprO/OprP
MISKYAVVLLAGTVLAGVAPAQAQTQDVAAEVAALRARLQQLEERLAAAEAERAAAPAPAAAAPAASAAPATTTSFRGAPTFTSGGWSFKPRGRIQYDAGWVESPNGIADRGLGFSNELRRARLGVEGTIPGGFGYVFEADFADNGVEITDAILTYRASPRIALTVGQHNPFQSLEEVTSSRFSSFIERAAFTDAFNFERRVGLSATFSDGPLIVQGGVFTDNIEDLGNDENNSSGFDGRIVYAPKSGETQLHFGASGHFRSNGDLDDTGTTTRYRQRPLLHSTDTRFIGTPALAVENETSYGAEAALIRGPFHAAAEIHWLNADEAGRSPTFFGGYVEAGYFLTGETRGYRNGRFDRTSVENPVGEDGGLGAVQLNVRYDHLDLNSGTVRGGMQNGYLASLIWIPQDYVRLMLNLGHLRYSDAIVPAAGGDRDYGVNVAGVRAQIDF